MLAAFAILAVMSNDARPAITPDPAYAREIEAWRTGRLTRLKSDEGWLVVAGLFWLKEGANRFGSAPDAEVALPAHSAPAHAGVLRMAGGKVTVEVAPGVNVMLAGKKVAEGQELRSDEPG